LDERTRMEVTRLVKRGLNHYGLGDLEAAIGCWEQARKLDPANQAVRDYLDTAYEESDRTPRSQSEMSAGAREDATSGRAPKAVEDDDATPRSGPTVEKPRPGKPPAQGIPAAPPADAAVARALEAFRGGKPLEAWRDLVAIAEKHPDRLDVRGYIELVRKQLMQQWANEIGDRGRVLRLAKNTHDLLKLRLRPEEGFLLSQVDGRVTVDELISLSSSDRFSALEMIARFIREGILA
jgi:tetratricopeptide (TPR) repeat protein